MEIILPKNLTKKKSVEYKGAINLLTETDTYVEKTIIRLIKKEFPRHAILAEESGASSQREKADFTWIIDPIDGTTNFYHSFPHVATSIAIEKEGCIVMGGILDPIRDELFFAERGKGAFLNRKRIRVSSTQKLKNALLVTGFPYDRRKHADYYLSFFKAFMMRCHGIRRVGTAALDFCYVAAGRIDGFWEYKLKPWDVAAGKLIVEEAGGKVTDFNGKTFDIYGTETCASNSLIHREMKRVLQKNLLPI